MKRNIVDISERDDDDHHSSEAPEEYEDNFKEKLQSSFILLELAKSEYACEDERCKNVDNRTGLLISSIIVLLTFFLPSIDIKPFTVKAQFTFIEALVLALLLFFNVGTIVAAGTSLLYFFSSISVRNYQRLNTKYFQSEKFGGKPENLVAFSFAVKLAECIEYNRMTNNTKIARYKKGLISLIVMSLLMIISTLISKLYM